MALILADLTANKMYRFERVKARPSYLLRDEKDEISDHLRQTGQWEDALIARAKTYLRPDSNCLDIGANLGVWTVELSRATSGIVYAFEPQLEVFLQLCGNLFLNKCNNVKPMQCALGGPSELGKKVTMFTPDIHNNGFTYISDTPPTSELAAVNIMTLDSLSLPRIDFIKLDVEGYEEAVLRGGEQLLKSCRPVIFFESWTFKPVEQESFFSYLRSLNYRIEHLQGHDDFCALPNIDTKMP